MKTHFRRLLRPFFAAAAESSDASELTLESREQHSELRQICKDAKSCSTSWAADTRIRRICALGLSKKMSRWFRPRVARTCHWNPHGSRGAPSFLVFGGESALAHAAAVQRANCVLLDTSNDHKNNLAKQSIAQIVDSFFFLTCMVPIFHSIFLSKWTCGPFVGVEFLQCNWSNGLCSMTHRKHIVLAGMRHSVWRSSAVQVHADSFAKALMDELCERWRLSRVVYLTGACMDDPLRSLGRGEGGEREEGVRVGSFLLLV